MRIIPLILLCFTVHFSGAQSRFFEPADSINKKRVVAVTASIGGGSTLGMVGLWNLWYKNGDSGHWKFIDDSHSWLQMDKAGHFFTAYKLNQTTFDLYKWSGVSQTKAQWLGFGYGMAFQTTLECFDGFSSDWGFSWSDMGFNFLGASSFTAQQLIWKEERFIPKFSSFPTSYAALRPEILGSNFAESTLKDYNGQTYWLSFSPGTFMKNSSFPQWLCFSLGYSADQKIIGDQNTYTDPATGITYYAKREWLLSMDIDFSRLPIRKPWLKAVVKQFNYLKVPFPALILSNGKISGRPLYF